MESKRRCPPKIWIGIGAIILYLILVIVVLCQTLFLKPTKENELDIIQSMIENIEICQEDIESWGYQISIITPTREMKNKSWEHYYRDYYHYNHPILVLTDADGGMYYFYFGFDGYASEVTNLAMVKELYGDEYAEMRKTVRLDLYKGQYYQAPYWENPHDIGKVAYYDITVEIEIIPVPVDDEVFIWDYFDSCFNYTNYCSNNFVDTMRFDVYMREEKIHAADNNIKKEYSAEQLLEFYRQGLDLQERLFELYDANNEVSHDVP